MNVKFAADRGWRAGLVVMLILAAAATVPLFAGQDANWDFRNYHLYDPFALLHGRFGFDLVPAMQQTYFSPTMDLLLYGLIHALDSYPRAAAVIWSLPNGISIVLLGAFACRILHPRDAWGWIEVALATVFGATGATASSIGTSMSEGLPSAFLFAAVLILLPRREAAAAVWSWRHAVVAGVLAGCAAGFKLTAAPYVVAIVLALLFHGGRPLSLLQQIVVFGLGTALGLAATDGYWMLHLWQSFGNPFFPHFNDLFHSPWGEPNRLQAIVLTPQAILYPLLWATGAVSPVSEIVFRDPRIAIAMFAGILALPAVVLRWRCKPGLTDDLSGADARFVVVLFFSGYALWLAQYSIYRYLNFIELLSGLVLVVLARQLSPWLRPRLAILGLTAIVALVVTDRVDWGHVPFGDQILAVTVPQMAPDSIVVMPDDVPLAYLALFSQPDTRFVSPLNNLSRPERRNLLQQQINSLLLATTAPLYTVTCADCAPAASEKTLHLYHLHREDADCRPIRSNIDAADLRLCRVSRTGG